MHFTQNPIGSDDQLDLQDNAISFDYAMNSPAALWQDRFGKQHKTVQQALKDVGFKPAGFDFVSGGTLGIGDRDKCVFYPTDGYWYSWNGKLPYVAPANSSPTPGGKKGWGVITRDERVIAREALRRTYLEAGYNLVEGSFEQGGALVKANDVLLQERTGRVFSGPAGIVPAGTDPAGGGFVDVTDSWRNILFASTFGFVALTYRTDLANLKESSVNIYAVKLNDSNYINKLDVGINRGDLLTVADFVTGGKPWLKCITAGTATTRTTTALGTTTLGSNVATLTTLSGLKVGDYIKIGAAYPGTAPKILSMDAAALTVKLSYNPNAAVTDGAVTLPAPIFE